MQKYKSVCINVFLHFEQNKSCNTLCGLKKEKGGRFLGLVVGTNGTTSIAKRKTKYTKKPRGDSTHKIRQLIY